MKKIGTFVRDRIVTGVLVIVPIAVVAIVLKGSIEKLIDFTKPFTSNIEIGGALTKSIIAAVILILVLGIFFLISGILLKSYLGERVNNWLEEKILNKIPFFKTLKGVTRQFTGEDSKKHIVVEADVSGNGSKLLGIQTESLADGKCIVYCPFSPLINIGQIYVVKEENLTRTKLTIKDFADIISQAGFESDKFSDKVKIN